MARRSTACSGAGNYTVLRTEAVGPKVGGELRQKAFLAILLSFFAVLAYLAYRFEWRFGLAAVVATAHDILATIAFIGVMRLEVSLTVVAAVLSMVGYSLNDTIIIFDRVRENLRKHKKEAFEEILNRSINETLPRSVLTHGTTLATLIALDDLRRRSDPALRAGHVLRRLHRHVLVDLHRLAGAHGDRAPLARARRPVATCLRRRRRPAAAPGSRRQSGRVYRARPRQLVTAPRSLPAMLTDTHCHLADPAYDPGRPPFSPGPGRRGSARRGDR